MTSDTEKNRDSRSSSSDSSGEKMLTLDDTLRLAIDFFNGTTFDGDRRTQKAAAELCERFNKFDHREFLRRQAREIERMRPALERIAKQHTSDEMEDVVSEDADWVGGYDGIILVARAVLSELQLKATL